MALPATHIRFAAALSERLSVANMPAYLSGTLYPDSRWLTGVDRKQTHDRRFLDPGFPENDFDLGWHIHCAADRIQADIHASLFPDLAELAPDDRWIRVSAAKAVQDRSDADGGKLDGWLPFLNDTRTPNGESAEGVAAYLGLVRRVYSRGTAQEWSGYAELWAGVGLGRRKIGRIEEQMERILADEALVNQLQGSFSRMVHRYVSSGVMMPINRSQR